jgi:YidC/Oxa1 family membrane protein insertase
MDRQSIMGFVLIFVILMVWMYVNAPEPQPVGTPQTTQNAKPETTRVEPRPPVARAVQDTTSKNPQDRFGRYFADRVSGREQRITIETDLYKATLSTKGALLEEWEVKQYLTWDGHPVQLVDYEAHGDLGLRFMASDGKLIETRHLYFDAPMVPRNIVLTGDQQQEVRLILPASNGGTVTKVFRFKNGAYDFDVELIFNRMADVVSNYKYELSWESGLRFTERNSVDESSFSEAHIFAAGEHTTLDASNFEEPVKGSHQGMVDWVATNTKYFLLAVIPQESEISAIYLEGRRSHAPDNGVLEHYALTLEVPYKGRMEERETFKIFIGPSDYRLLDSYDIGLENVIYLGWGWIVRPISVYVMLPVFVFLHMFIPNWGIILIIFAIIIKVALHPLTKTSMKSMKRMQALQPMMNEIREKYKDDPQKMNSQIMGLYKEYGVNPAGGCLPMLLQFPILIALYNVFRTAIELRQAEFFWWIKDLSIPDVIAVLPFSIPLFGIQEVSGLAVLMGITTFIQQKMSVKDPRQKAMVWMMPLMMTLLFNSFPSGLNLYYFVFNLLSIGQQMYINKQHDQEPLRKVDPKRQKRGGIFGRLGDIPRLNKKN